MLVNKQVTKRMVALPHKCLTLFLNNMLSLKNIRPVEMKKEVRDDLSVYVPNLQNAKNLKNA